MQLRKCNVVVIFQNVSSKIKSSGHWYKEKKNYKKSSKSASIN